MSLVGDELIDKSKIDQREVGPVIHGQPGASGYGYVGLNREQQEPSWPLIGVWSNPMFKSVKNFAHDSGVTAIVYALIASLIAVFIITAVQTVGTKTSTVYTELANTLD